MSRKPFRGRLRAVFRRTNPMPFKSGAFGLLLCAGVTLCRGTARAGANPQSVPPPYQRLRRPPLQIRIPAPAGRRRSGRAQCAGRRAAGPNSLRDRSIRPAGSESLHADQPEPGRCGDARSVSGGSRGRNGLRGTAPSAPIAMACSGRAIPASSSISTGPSRRPSR